MASYARLRQRAGIGLKKLAKPPHRHLEEVELETADRGLEVVIGDVEAKKSATLDLSPAAAVNVSREAARAISARRLGSARRALMGRRGAAATRCAAAHYDHLAVATEAGDERHEARAEAYLSIQLRGH